LAYAIYYHVRSYLLPGKEKQRHQAGRGKYLKERVIEIHTLIVGCIWLEIWPEYLLNIHTTLLDWNMLRGGEQC
jgi:hypothetical protein